MYIRKTRDIYVLQGFYCGCWEDLVEYDSRREAREDLQAYNDNETGVLHRIVKRREKINREV